MLHHPDGSAQMAAFPIPVPHVPVLGGVDGARDWLRRGFGGCGRHSRASADLRGHGEGELVELGVSEVT